MNNITEVRSARTGDSYYRIDHESGLTIYLYPKPGYNSKYAIFGTRYGSVNNAFSLDGGEVKKVPDGIAHYLEHKMFECEDGDAFVKYAKTGANANAYTSFDKTCYLFSCTENFDESFRILLDFVQRPYFTEQTVAKEQGIIGQEIRMYDDSPDWRVMFNMLENMYHKHPVQLDIAGTVESIAKITPELLYDCYYTYYNLNNMVLAVAGDLSVEDILKTADAMLKPCEKHSIENYFEDEPYEVVSDYVEQKFPVAMPMFNLGFKEKAHKLTQKEMAEIEIAVSLLSSPSSTLYKKLDDLKLINQSYDCEYFSGQGYNAFLFSGESRSPKETAEVIKNYIDEIKTDGVDKEEFEIARREVYGDAVSGLNSVDNIANTLADFHFNGFDIFGLIDDIASVTLDDINKRLKNILDTGNTTLSVVSSPES
ncbi:MAG: pitrilysin family protein [Ruminococcus sp.]|jgi:predicted Zn-dependent peptidase|nr:pitrilysin family protein [Ruminococcus sp.]